MKKIIAMVALVFSCMLAYAQTNGEVIVMNKAMFIKDVFDYEIPGLEIQRETSLPS